LLSIGVVELAQRRLPEEVDPVLVLRDPLGVFQ
jgi:hypothetical protein